MKKKAYWGLALSLSLLISLLALGPIFWYAQKGLRSSPQADLPGLPQGAAERLTLAIRQQGGLKGRNRLSSNLKTYWQAAFVDLWTHPALRRYDLEEGLLWHWPGTKSGGHAALILAEYDPGEPDTARLIHWKHEPYLGLREEGKVWGKGSRSQLANTMAWLEVWNRLAAEGFRPQNDLYLLLLRDSSAYTQAQALLPNDELAWLWGAGGQFLELAWTDKDFGALALPSLAWPQEEGQSLPNWADSLSLSLAANLPWSQQWALFYGWTEAQALWSSYPPLAAQLQRAKQPLSPLQLGPASQRLRQYIGTYLDVKALAWGLEAQSPTWHKIGLKAKEAWHFSPFLQSFEAQIQTGDENEFISETEYETVLRFYYELLRELEAQSF